MAKQLLIGAFDVNGLNLASPGLWASPEDERFQYTDLGRWVDLARLLDGGGFDFLFLADTYGYPILDGQVPDVVIEQAVDLPKNDPLLLIPTLAHCTRHLCFAVTSSTTFEPPFANARRFSTVDHLSKGRIAWNVVTTSSKVVTDLFGHESFTPHDKRYEVADEFMELSYKLFEGSWEDQAVVVDKENRIYARAEQVHEINHAGRHFRMRGIFNCEPSPQRTPVIFQAGASKAGRAFAGRHAEVVVLQGGDRQMLREQVRGLRETAVAAGRSSEDIKIVLSFSAVVGASRQEAEQKLERYLSFVDPYGSQVYYSYMSGVELAKLDPDLLLKLQRTELGQTQLERYGDKTVREVSTHFMRYGLRDYIAVGTGAEIASEIATLAEETDIDGINLYPFVVPGSYAEFITGVMPALNERGLIAERGAPQTFRERLLGRGRSRLPSDHPGAQYRRAKARYNA